MKEFATVSFDLTKARAELAELKLLLDNSDELSETKDILPFFKGRQQLSTFLASFNADIPRPNVVAHEFPLFGDLRTDVIAGDSKHHSFAFIEFEDARKESVFVATGRHLPEWSSRLEHGFGQIVDWFWKIADFGNTADFEAKFGSRAATFVGVLVVGRSKFLSGQDRQRLNVRRDKLLVDSRRVICCTYDELYDLLHGRLSLLDAP
jgi:hypothetical protein